MVKQLNMDYVTGFLENVGGFFYTTRTNRYGYKYPLFRIAITNKPKFQEKIKHIKEIIKFLERELNIKFYMCTELSNTRFCWYLMSAGGLTEFIKFANESFFLEKPRQKEITDLLKNKKIKLRRRI